MGADLGESRPEAFRSSGQQTTGTPTSAVGTNLPPKRSESEYTPPKSGIGNLDFGTHDDLPLASVAAENIAIAKRARHGPRLFSESTGHMRPT